jgi:hypothetical protein
MFIKGEFVMAKNEPKLEIKAKLSGTDDWKEWCKEKAKRSSGSSGMGGAAYGLGFVGALVYWMQAAVGFGAVVTGILKAIIWPAYIVYKLLENFYGVVL